MKYPLFKQNGFKDCGPCSLASVISYYGGYMSVDSLEGMMNTTKDGTTAYNLVETARKIGFESYGLKVDSLDNLKFPLIAYVTINKTYNHFVVVYKVDDKVLIGDPASKVKYITKDEFNKIWNNVVIILKPVRKLPFNKPKSLFNYLKDIFILHRFKFISLIIISLLYASITLIYSLLIKMMIDNILILKTYIILFLFLFLFKILFAYYKDIKEIDLNKRISKILVSRINNSLITLPYIYYKNHRIGEIVSRFNDIYNIQDFIKVLILFFVELPFMFVIFLLIYLFSRMLFILVSIITFVYLILSILISNKLESEINNVKHIEASYNSYFVETLNGFETIKGINIEKNIINKLNDKYSSFMNNLRRFEKKNSVRENSLDIILGIGDLLIIICGLLLMNKGMITISTVLIIYVLFNYLKEPLNIMISLLIIYRKAKVAARRIQELSYVIASDKDCNGNIEFNHESFKMGINKILNNINLKIKKGEKVIITGVSGSGKSTLVKLIKGYYKSHIRIGNKSVDTKLNNVSYISKNDFLFEDTLYSNLMCDDLEKVNEIIKLCHVKNNLNMFIEENGFNVSGGEKARIVLARTLLKPFDILIIDEGLDEVDQNTERKILKNIFDKFIDKTIIVISHRLDNMDLYNHWIEVGSGKIINDVRKENI